LAAEIGQPFERSFIFLYALSYVFLLICLLSAFYLGIVKLQAFGSIYLAMLTLGLVFMRGIEPEKQLLTGLILGVPSLFLISALFTAIAQQWQIMGVLTITEWSTEAAARNPLTLKLGDLALSLGITPQLLLSLMMNIPGPIAEETFFRIALYHLLKPTMGERYSLIAQAIIFGLFHYYAYSASLWGLLSATTAGIALGLIYQKTQSECSICLSHIIYNVFTIMVGQAT